MLATKYLSIVSLYIVLSLLPHRLSAFQLVVFFNELKTSDSLDTVRPLR